MTEHVKISQSEGVLEVTFARPEKKNALSNAMYRAASAAIEAAQTDNSIRAVLIASEGDAFTAGNDLGDFANAANEEPQAGRFIRAIINAEKPLIAAVHGLAVGVGTTMLLHCDLVYVTEEAKLLTPFVNLALVPEAGASALLPARVGHVRAFAMFALNEGVSGAEAVSLGLANKLVGRDQLLQTARDAAQSLTKKPLGSLLATKKLMRNMEGLEAHISVEGRQFGERMRSEEAREAFRAFAERRPPDFSKFS